LKLHADIVCVRAERLLVLLYARVLNFLALGYFGLNLFKPIFNLHLFKL
jgi:hypothetical protein